MADKIIKLRYTHNLRQEDLADLLNMHCSAIDGWEVHNVMPKPISIKEKSYIKMKVNHFI